MQNKIEFCEILIFCASKIRDIAKTFWKWSSYTKPPYPPINT